LKYGKGRLKTGIGFQTTFFYLNNHIARFLQFSDDLSIIPLRKAL
jgi:hypothetical protein